MTDEAFESFLREALAPPEREPDRAFTARVRAQVLLEERLRGERVASLRQLAFEIVGVLAVAAGLLWLARSPEVAEFVGESPAIALAAMLAAFMLLIAVMAAAGPQQPAREMRRQ